MKREDRCCKSDVSLKKVVSLLPTDYENLTNLPTINGISILGDLTAKELNILSADSSDYETLTLSSIEDTSTKYLVVLDESEEAQKIAVSDFITETQLIVTSSLNEDASVGTVQFVQYS